MGEVFKGGEVEMSNVVTPTCIVILKLFQDLYSPNNYHELRSTSGRLINRIKKSCRRIESSDVSRLNIKMPAKNI